MGDSANLIAGPCVVSVEISSVDTDIGFTKGGVRISRELRTLPLMADQLGDEAASEVIIGSDVKVSFAFAEVTLANLRRAMIDAVTLQDDTTSTKQATEIRALTGKSTTGERRKWTFKPIDPATGVATTDQNKWVTAYKAAPSAGTVELVFAHDEQRVIPIELVCYSDSAANDYRKIRFGDTTIVDANESGFAY
jgi:hypothetical protein